MLALLTVALAACGSANPAESAPGLASSARRPVGPVGVMYVANRDGAGVIGIPFKEAGDVPPVFVLKGAKTTLTAPRAIAFDVLGRLYVANAGATEVAVFAEDAGGNAAPQYTLGGTSSHLGPTDGLVIDRAGNLWVSNYTSNTIAEYAAGAKGERRTNRNHRRRRYAHRPTRGNDV